jgi:hypothetical protein
MKALLSLSDAESSTYDVFLLGSRLGTRPNPLANWKHAIFYYWVVGDPEAVGASLQGD